MKKFLIITVLLAVGVSSLIMVSISSDSDSLLADAALEKKERMPKDVRIAEAIEYRMSKLVNLETGVFNPADYNKAVAKADALKSAATNKNGVLNMNWESLGPDNVGGRTRSILFDKDDANLVYAASVGGGLYKSTNLGANWAPVDTYTGFATIASITQANDNFGSIFVGTGEGLSQPGGAGNNSGNYGNGIYVSRDAGATWEVIEETESTDDGFGVSPDATWGVVNDLEVSPVNSGLIMAATGNGLQISSNANDSPANITFTTVSGINGNGQAVEIASDGSFAVAMFNGRAYRSNDITGNFQTWTQSTGIPTNGGRGDIVISPSNPNYVYASKVNTNACLLGIYRSTDGGITFTEIVAGGAPYELDPFNQPSADFGICEGQGWYDQSIEVNPVDENKIYIGGIAFYTWGAGTGGIKKANIIDSEGGSFFDPQYIHADIHEIVFSPHDATGNTAIIAGDGGMVITKNAITGFPDNISYRGLNKNYNTYQVYGMGAGRFSEVIAGAQDNGSQYIDYLGTSVQGANEVTGGDGTYGEVSNFDYNVMFSSSQFGAIRRSINRGESANAFVDNNIDGNSCGVIHCNNTTACGANFAPFITPFFLMETSTRSDVQQTGYIIARDDTLILANGETLIVRDTFPAGPALATSGNVGSIQYPVTLATTLMPGETAFFDDPYDARYYVTSSCGIWMCSNPLEVSEQATFYRFTASNGPIGYDASRDGDALYTVLGDSRLIIYTGLNSINLPPGGCDSENNTPCISGYNTISINVGSNLQLEGVAVDKNDPNTVLVTSGGFGSTSHVYRIENALSGAPTIVALQPNDNSLPYMPMYGCIIDANNASNYVIATELGMWSSADAGQTWTEENLGLDIRMPVYSLRQEWVNAKWGVDPVPLDGDDNYNYDETCMVLYAGTHGRGMFRSTSLSGNCPTEKGQWPGEVTSIRDVNEVFSNIKLYPNPAVAMTDIVFDTKENSDINLRVVDMSGKVVLSQVFPNLTKGTNAIRFNASELSSGNYIAVISSRSGATQSTKFVKK